MEYPVFEAGSRPLNAAQVKALFEREAALIGREDNVPEFRAVSLFGTKSVDHVHALNRSNPGRYSNSYGVGDFAMMVLTLRGFQAAASFYNVQMLRKEVQA